LTHEVPIGTLLSVQQMHEKLPEHGRVIGNFMYSFAAWVFAKSSQAFS
jgi:hypothetical protein